MICNARGACPGGVDMKFMLQRRGQMACDLHGARQILAGQDGQKRHAARKGILTSAAAVKKNVMVDK